MAKNEPKNGNHAQESKLAKSDAMLHTHHEIKKKIPRYKYWLSISDDWNVHKDRRGMLLIYFSNISLYIYKKKKKKKKEEAWPDQYDTFLRWLTALHAGPGAAVAVVVT